VRVIDSVGRLVVVIRKSIAIAAYLSAPNAQPVFDNRGQLRAIKLVSFGDDRGVVGERHGSSLVTTERCKNEYGEYMGTLLENGRPTVLKHKLDRSDVL
jgi:hypothetical protein